MATAILLLETGDENRSRSLCNHPIVVFNRLIKNRSPQFTTEIVVRPLFIADAV